MRVRIPDAKRKKLQETLQHLLVQHKATLQQILYHQIRITRLTHVD